jgi:hypothetical protein
VRRPTAVALLAALGVTSAQTSREVRLELVLPSVGSRATEAPVVRSVNVLADSRMRDLLRNGFPARLHYRVELWSTKGWFDDVKAQTEWDVIVRYDALDQQFTVARIEGEKPVTWLGRYQKIEEAEQVLDRPFRPTIQAPSRKDRHYYHLALDVEMLSVNDLDEVERWLRGELRPAVRGKRNPGTALTRGLRTVIVKLLGGENRHYEARTPTFRPE